MESIFKALETFRDEQPFRGKLAEMFASQNEEAASIMSSAYLKAFEALSNSDKNLKGDHLERSGIKFGDATLGWSEESETEATESIEDENLRKYHWSC